MSGCHVCLGRSVLISRDVFGNFELDNTVKELYDSHVSTYQEIMMREKERRLLMPKLLKLPSDAHTINQVPKENRNLH